MIFVSINRIETGRPNCSCPPSSETLDPEDPNTSSGSCRLLEGQVAVVDGKSVAKSKSSEAAAQIMNNYTHDSKIINIKGDRG